MQVDLSENEIQTAIAGLEEITNVALNGIHCNADSFLVIGVNDKIIGTANSAIDKLDRALQTHQMGALLETAVIDSLHAWNDPYCCLAQLAQLHQIPY